MFDKFDSDKSGAISNQELGYVLQELGFDAAYVDDEICRGDLDGDGTLSFEEFVTWFNLIAEFQSKPQHWVKKFDQTENAYYYVVSNGMVLGCFIDVCL